MQTKKKKSRNHKKYKIKKSKPFKSYKQFKKGGSCPILDRQYENMKNNIWDTCISYNGKENNIMYITPKNVMIKSIETFQIPTFIVSNNGEKQCSIMIEDKYVGCFLKIDKQWYAIMRLFGKTINTGFFARTETNKAYYKINNNNFNIQSDGSIVLQKYSTITPNTIKLDNNDNVVIKSASVEFGLLQNFRNQKLFANAEKKQLAQNGMFDLLQIVM
jgi:hypothetical protein